MSCNDKRRVPTVEEPSPLTYRMLICQVEGEHTSTGYRVLQTFVYTFSTQLADRERRESHGTLPPRCACNGPPFGIGCPSFPVCCTATGAPAQPRGPALRCVLVCTHNIHKGWSTFGRSTENGPASPQASRVQPRSQKKCQPSWSASQTEHSHFNAGLAGSCWWRIRGLPSPSRSPPRQGPPAVGRAVAGESGSRASP